LVAATTALEQRIRALETKVSGLSQADQDIQLACQANTTQAQRLAEATTDLEQRIRTTETRVSVLKQAVEDIQVARQPNTDQVPGSATPPDPEPQEPAPTTPIPMDQTQVLELSNTLIFQTPPSSSEEARLKLHASIGGNIHDLEVWPATMSGNDVVISSESSPEAFIVKRRGLPDAWLCPSSRVLHQVCGAFGLDPGDQVRKVMDLAQLKQSADSPNTFKVIKPGRTG
jgi:hypothetical protein